jgi:DNA primase
MPRLSESFIQQVLQATDIVELVGQFVALNPKGREFVGLCPFHDDRNPSMYVVPAKQIYHCFVCGAGGNATKFLMEYEKCSFPEAVLSLAEKAGIAVPQDAVASGAPPGLSRNDLLATVGFAARFFAAQLREPGGQHALDYARSRGLTDESIDAFGLGYAPQAWEALLSAARREGFSDEQLVAAGLAKRREQSGGCYDVFRNRLIFPIHDPAGRVVAFGGRALSDDEQAKYLNSPESSLFEKSSLVFGLPMARDAIRQARQAVVVEGYLDVLLPHQAGVQNLVATLGTALGERHVRLLGRFAEEVVLVFDADEAGTHAAERALELFLAQKVHVRVATIPSGKDPADFVLAEGPDALRELIAAAPDALQFAWDRRRADLLAAEAYPARRQAVVEDFLRLVVHSAVYGAIDGVAQQNLAQHIAHVLNTPAVDLQQRMRRLARQAGPTRRPLPDNPQPVDAYDRPNRPTGAAGDPERHVLEVLLDKPELFDDAAEKIDPADFRDALLRTIAQRLWQRGNDGELTFEDLLAGEDMTSLQGELIALARTAQRRGNHEQTLHGAVSAILQRKHREETDAIKSNGFDDDTLRSLQERLRQGDPRRRPGIR